MRNSGFLELLKALNVTHLPLVDEEERVAGLVTSEQMERPQALPLVAVIMAGGKGTRLYPLTEELPKPMLEIGGRPLLELIIQQLRAAGVSRITITTHYKPEKIQTYFGDGRKFGVVLTYIMEERPLGTIGGLGLMKTPQGTTLVINGDILTQVNFRALLAFHQEHQADLTITVRQHDLKVPYGVVECEGPRVRRMQEKPVVGFFVNAGIYLLQPLVYRFISRGERLNMPELIHRLLAQDRSIVSFPLREYWMDIGQHPDYAQAKKAAESWELGVPKIGSAPVQPAGSSHRRERTRQGPAWTGGGGGVSSPHRADAIASWRQGAKRGQGKGNRQD